MDSQVRVIVKPRFTDEAPDGTLLCPAAQALQDSGGQFGEDKHCKQQLKQHAHVKKVMDNLLVQVTGRKKVVLFSPQDAAYLYLSGDKSEVLDIDSPDLKKYPEFIKAKRYECCLKPGDVLFIPALWFHNTVAEEFGVGVNVFWKHLPSEFYDKTDTYGNKDPLPAARAMQILDRALKAVDELPEEYQDFYARRMVLRIQNKFYRTSLN
ncbi:TYW5 protein, partial [Polypterus senegalus]